MSKNITIAEGTQAKNFNGVSKIRTNVIGGGTQNWIPEDEAGRYANLGDITISENGTYFADDEGVDGFSKVSVNVSGSEARLIEKTITQNGTYNASSDDADGYSKIIISVEATHGRTLVNGLNNAAASQRISTKDFFADLSEQAYAAGMSYFTDDRTKMWLQSYIRTGNWVWSSARDILDYDNLVLIGAGGICTPSLDWTRMTIWVSAVGIFDDSGLVSLFDLTENSFSGSLDTGNKFTYSYGGIEYAGMSGGGSFGHSGWDNVKSDLSNHRTGSNSIHSISGQGNVYYPINTSLPHTPIITNLTGGTIA